MSFYQALAPYYDRIFPLNQTAFTFLASYLNEKKSLLDVGAGTGSMAIAFAEKGADVTALEPEETMAKNIQEKAKSKEVSMVTTTKSMEQIDQLQNTFDGIYCIGNTLAHLPNIQAVESFINKCYQKLNENGAFMIQLVNYEKVLSSDQFSFPVITKEDFTFTREYEKEADKILFTTTLTTSEDSIVNTVPLFPVTSQQLVPILEQAGFHSVQRFGNFKGKTYTTDSPALIVVLNK